MATLHQLSYTYSQTKFGGANQEILRSFGRLAGWMFRGTSRDGQPTRDQCEQRGERRLRVPCADRARYQLAWLTPGDRERQDGAVFEALTVSPTLDRRFERKPPAISSRRTMDDAVGHDVTSVASEIASDLRPEVERNRPRRRTGISQIAAAR